MTVAARRGNYEHLCENVDKKSSSCGQLLKISKWRYSCHNEREVKIDEVSEARFGDDNSQRDEAKRQRYHAEVWLLGRRSS